jgi:hypothetical protein
MTKGQIREERRTRSRARARRKKTFLMIAGIAFALVFITALVIPRNTQGSVPQGLNSGGPVALDADEGRDHIEGNAWYPDEYLTVPATSGPHWEGDDTPIGLSSPAPWGRYNAELPDEILIHNLEHGGIGYHYDCEDECPDVVKALDDLMPRDTSLYIMAPYPDLPTKIVITAWRHRLELDEVDPVKIIEFINEYQDRAPESIR